MDGQGVRDFYAGLPAGLAQALLTGSVGFRHLRRAADMAVAAGGGGSGADGLAALGRGLALEAWTFDPLNPELAAHALALGRNTGGLPPQAEPVLEAVARLGTPPENLDYYVRLAAKRQPDKLAAYLADRVDREPDSLFWRARALALAAFAGDWEGSLRIAHTDWPEVLAPLARAVAGDAYFFMGEYVKAHAAYQCLGPVFGPARTASMSAACLRRMDRTEHAAAELERAVAGNPWRVNDLLVLFELARTPAPARLEGGLAVLLYTFNKADSLNRTLAALASSDLGDAALIALDNGCTDATPEVLAAWKDRLGDTLGTVTLPVNIGAPAARNWLAQLPAVRERAWAMYLDDDALVPRDWREKFAQATARCPEAGVYGLKVADAAAPWTLQSVDYHLGYDQEPAPGAPPDYGSPSPNPFRVTNLHLQCLDMGWFDYVRPCLSVTGCCHLMRTRDLAGEGFSIYLSPSQYDDLERDVRLGAKGGHACYQGGLALLHEKRSGAAGRTDPVQEGQALGNRCKLEILHPHAEIRAMMDRDADLALADLAAKADALAQGVKKT